MRSTKYGLGLAITAACMGLGTSAASADTAATRFETPGFVAGNPNGQNGWQRTGTYDSEIVSGFAGAPASFGSQSLRISNAITSGSFGDHLFSAATGNEAGEPSAVSDGQSGGVRQTQFVAQWKFVSTQATEQPGLAMTASADRGDGARMTWVQMADDPAGLKVVFNEYDTDAAGGAGDFVQRDIATALARNTVHTIRQEIDFVAGVNNDVVRTYVDGVLVDTGNSWEDYYREVETNPTRPVDSVLLRQGGAAAATSGQGFLIDDFSVNTSSPTSGPPGTPGLPGNNGNNGNNGLNGATGQQGAQGGQGPQGTSGLTPSSTTTTTRKLSLLSKSVKASKRRKVSVRVSCPRANRLCEGRLVLRKGRKIIARQSFLVRGGRSGKVTFSLSKKAYKALKKSQSVKLDSFSRDLAGVASESSKTLTLKK